MKITDEMYDKVVLNKKKVNYIDDEYVLLYKKMPCTDQELERYINSLNELRYNGVNISNIIDYRLVPGTTSTYKTGSYTNGVYLERLAKGKCIADIKDIHLDSNVIYDFGEVTKSYKCLVNDYILELEKRGNADYKIYDKFISDYKSFEKYNLVPDPKPLNFFFDDKEGFGIIDVIPLVNNDIIDLSYILFLIVCGYHAPRLNIGNSQLVIVNEENKKRIDIAMNNIETKISFALKKNGYKDEEIKEAIIRNRNRFDYILVENIEKFICEKYEEENLKKSVESSLKMIF